MTSGMKDLFVEHTFHRTPSGRYWHWSQWCRRVPRWHWRYPKCSTWTTAPGRVLFLTRCPHCWPIPEYEA